MHKNFADWYNAVSLRPDARTLEARWKAVEALASRIVIAQVPSLVRVFFFLPGADELLDEIRTAARDEDKTFLTEGDRSELAVLAGGVIAQTVTNSSDLAHAVALGVSCADAQSLRQTPRLQAVVDETMRYLADESVRARTIGENPVAEVSTESINLGLRKVLTRQREQSDILWWLFSEHTLDGTKAFRDLTVPEACFWGAKDLAELTLFLPGPFAAPAFLHKMLRLVRNKVPAKFKISEAVDACGVEWKQKWAATLTGSQVLDLSPMLFAVTKSVEVGGGTGWTAAFEHATGLAAHASLAPSHLALQVYNEALLLRALSVQE